MIVVLVYACQLQILQDTTILGFCESIKQGRVQIVVPNFFARCDFRPYPTSSSSSGLINKQFSTSVLTNSLMFFVIRRTLCFQ